MNFICRNITISFVLLIAINFISFSQDTTKPKVKPVSPKDTSTVQNFILADHNYQYLNKTNPDTLTRRRFLWYPAKSLEDIFNYLPGYYLSFMDIGQRNQLTFNQSVNPTMLLRHGRPLNDVINATVDMDLLSRNEIAEIELSNSFGNNIYNYNNSINIIERELFQFRPYTEISFYQDRYENLYFDGNFHQNFFRKLNFNFGITKHSYDGHYTNSDFDKWLGRFNLNFAPSNKLNFALNVNYAKIQKGLNEGINSDTVNLGDKEQIFNTTKAIVNNSDAYEIKERFDIDLNSFFLIGKNSYTRLQAYVSNSFRMYRDEENRPNPNGIFIKNNYHWISYGAKIQQEFKLNPLKDLKLLSRSEIEFSDELVNITYSDAGRMDISADKQYYRYLENIDAVYKNFILSGYIKGYSFNSLRYRYSSYGIKARYGFNIDSLNRLYITTQYNSLFNFYSSAEVGFESNNNRISSEFYYYMFDDNRNYKGLNNRILLHLFKFDFEGTYSYSIVPLVSLSAYGDEGRQYYPTHSGNLNISWHDMAFKNKLEYKIGLNSRFWSDYYSQYYEGSVNSTWYPYSAASPNYNLKIPANATLDFYIIGKIGKATFGLTLENILDRIIYNMGVYPFMDRGGFINTISRFNITWNFFD